MPSKRRQMDQQVVPAKDVDPFQGEPLSGNSVGESGVAEGERAAQIGLSEPARDIGV